MTEHLLSTLGLALRAGAVAVGEEPVGAAARAKKARVIFTARDAAASSVRRAYSFGRAGSCLCLPCRRFFSCCSCSSFRSLARLAFRSSASAAAP